MSSNQLPETRAARRFRRFFEEQGKAEGKREALLNILAARGLKPSAEDGERIAACTDADLLDEWIVRATMAASVEDVLRPATR